MIRRQFLRAAAAAVLAPALPLPKPAAVPMPPEWELAILPDYSWSAPIFLPINLSHFARRQS